MTNLINQDASGITYLNYMTGDSRGETVSLISSVQAMLTTAWGVAGSHWNGSSYMSVRPPAPGIETITGTVGTGTYVTPGANERLNISWAGNDRIHSFSTTTTSDRTSTECWFSSTAYIGGINIDNDKYFGVCDDYSLSVVRFNSDMTSVNRIATFGWLKDYQYNNSTNFPQSFYLWDTALLNEASSIYRCNVVNTQKRAKSTTNFMKCSLLASILNPTIDCVNTTPGANAMQLIFRDDSSPNNYVGVIRNFIQSPVEVPVGQIVENIEIDPDGSENPYWISVGLWGASSLLMRVWAENVV